MQLIELRPPTSAKNAAPCWTFLNVNILTTPFLSIGSDIYVLSSARWWRRRSWRNSKAHRGSRLLVENRFGISDTIARGSHANETANQHASANLCDGRHTAGLVGRKMRDESGV